MSSLGKAALHLQRANFKFSHTFIICDKTPETDTLFGIDIQKRYSLSYSWDVDKQLFIQREGSFLAYTRDCEQQHNIAVVKSPLKIPPRHNGIIPVTIKGHNLKAPLEYFISNQHINRRCDPSIHVIDGIYNIKDKLTLPLLVANYTNKYVTFNKGQCIGHTEPSIDHMLQTAIKSLTTQKMIDECVQPDTFTLSLHTLLDDVRESLNQLLESFKSQFTQDETSIGTTHLTKIQIDMGPSEPVSQRSYAITVKHYDWVRSEINKLLDVQVINSGHSSWSAPNIVVPKEEGGKFLLIDYRALNKVTQKFVWPMPRVEDIFSRLNGAKYFSTLNLCTGYHHIPLDEDSIPKTAFTSPFGKYDYLKFPFKLAQTPAYFQELMNKVSKDLPFAIVYLDDIIIYSKTANEHLDHVW